MRTLDRIRILAGVTMAAATLLSGCTGTALDPGSASDPARDLGSAIDLSPKPVPTVDLAPPVLLDLSTSIDFGTTADLRSSGTADCLAVVTCVVACNSPSCVDACVAKGTIQAQGYYQALVSCGYGVCGAPSGGAPPACGSSADRSAACTACVESAAQSAACSQQLNDCVSH
jgi:hypothetical protein